MLRIRQKDKFQTPPFLKKKKKAVDLSLDLQRKQALYFRFLSQRFVQVQFFIKGPKTSFSITICV